MTIVWFICQVECGCKSGSWRIKRASSFYACVRSFLKNHVYIYKIISLSEYLRQKVDFWRRETEDNWGYFFEKLHSLLASGETLLTALTVLQEDKAMPQRFISKAITNLKNGLFIGALWNETSLPLNEGQKHLLQSAEQGGFFTQGVKQIRTVLRFQAIAKQQIRRGLVYPGCVLGVMIVFMFVLSF